MKPKSLYPEKEEPKPFIPTIDRLIFYIILTVVFSLLIVGISYAVGYNSAYYYNSPLILG